MKEREDKGRYIVVRQPNDNNAYCHGLRIIHIVITYEELHKKMILLLKEVLSKLKVNIQ